MRTLALHTLRAGVLFLLSSETMAQDVAREDKDTPEAATDAATRLEQIVVTGSRIKRIEIEGPLPISVIEREDFLRRGEFSLSDAIRDLPYNSFGSAGDDPRFNSPNAAVPRLRGLDPKYTLVLLDGLRLPGLADLSGGASASLTGIPFAAVDRVEVLREGASAVYGSDAIGGVINLLTRRDDVAPQFEVQIEQPQDDGGEAWRASFVTGRGNEHGNWLLALETQDREPLYGRQRDYLIAGTYLIHTGNPGTFVRIDPETEDFVGGYTPDPRCPQATDTDPLFPSSGLFEVPAGEICGYRFRDLNMERAAFEGRSLFASGRRHLTDTLDAVVRLQAVRGDSVQQLAPAPVDGLFIAEDNPHNPTLGERGPGLGYPLYMSYRLTSIGPRINESEELSLHSLAGLAGTLDWARGGHWSATIYHNRYDLDSVGVSGHVLRSVLEQAIEDGSFDPFTAEPGNPAGLEHGLVHPQRESASRATGLELSATLDAAFFGGLEASCAFGLDLRRDRYRVDSDPTSIGGETVAGYGFEQEAANRRYAAVYGEMFVPLGARWEASLAARYDRYEDAGGALSPKLALGFRPGEAWLLRGSLASGFQAPDLVSAYGPEGEGFAFAVDQVDCAQNPDVPGACFRRPVFALLESNPALGTEHARQGSLGLVWQPGEHFDLALDYYRTRIRDQIGRLRIENALASELDCLQTGRACDPLRDGTVVRNDFGNVEYVVLPLINIAGTRTQGLDLEMGARTSTAIGDFGLHVTASRVLDFEIQALPERPVENVLGSFGAPKWRGNMRVDWELGDHGLSLGAEYSGGFGYCYPASFEPGGANPDCANRVSSHTEFDAQWRWKTPWGGELAVGGRNLANRPPPQALDGNFAYGLHDPVGRVWYLRYRHGFGARGASSPQ